MTASEIVRQIFQAMLDRLTAAEEELGKLDAAAGDGDHGTGMTRGLRAAVTARRLCVVAVYGQRIACTFITERA